MLAWNLATSAACKRLRFERILSERQFGFGRWIRRSSARRQRSHFISRHVVSMRSRRVSWPRRGGPTSRKVYSKLKAARHRCDARDAPRKLPTPWPSSLATALSPESCSMLTVACISPHRSASLDHIFFGSRHRAASESTPIPFRDRELHRSKRPNFLLSLTVGYYSYMMLSC